MPDIDPPPPPEPTPAPVTPEAPPEGAPAPAPEAQRRRRWKRKKKRDDQKPTMLEKLLRQYPVCFNRQQPRPLKVGIHGDLVAAGLGWIATRKALALYCAAPAYLETLVLGAPRIDLQGQPVGEVNEEEATSARLTLAGTPPPPRPGPPPLPEDAPIPKENAVPGRLELSLKFTELPKPLPVQSGMKIAIQTETSLVVTILPPRAWNKLVKANTEWPQWMALVTGKLAGKTGPDGAAVLILENPGVQVFERKPRAAG